MNTTRAGRRMFRLAAALLAVALFAQAWLRISRSRELGEAKWGLWSSVGTRLRGANVYQRRTYAALRDARTLGPGSFGPPFTQADFANLARQGANCVVLSHPGIFAESPPYGLDQAAEENLARLVDMAYAEGMWVVIAFRTGPGRSEFSILRDGAGDWFPSDLVNDAVWTDPSAQDAWAAMWRHTALRYADHPAVAGYHLMVEPNANVSRPGGAVWHRDRFYRDHGRTRCDWNTVYPRMLRAIRAVDRHTPVLVSPDGYASVHWLDRLIPAADSHCVYVVNIYDPSQYTHQPVAESVTGTMYPGWVDQGQGRGYWLDGSWLARNMESLRTYANWQGRPVAIGELGVQRWEPGAAEFLRDRLTLVEAAGVNYAVWLWECSSPAYATNTTAFNFRLGPDPVNVGTDTPNDLWDVIRMFWGRNLDRPASVKESYGKRVKTWHRVTRTATRTANES